MIIKIRPDKQKSESLINMAKVTLVRLESTNMKKYPSNTLKDYYDIIHEIMESLTLKEGIKIKGKGAHQELIDYISKQYKFTEQERIFLQQIRDYRNGISYEGFMINPNFISNNENKIRTIIDKLLKNI